MLERALRLPRRPTISFFLWGPRQTGKSSLLPKRPKRRVVQTPKFYFADVGIVNHLARRGRLERSSAARSFATPSVPGPTQRTRRGNLSTACPGWLGAGDSGCK
jgi:predicted AAA+ superfamily ATPase